MHTARIVLSLVLLLLCAPVRADLIEMADGRKFEGSATTLEGGDLRIEIMIGGKKAALTVRPDKVKHVESKPLPAGFFDPKPAEPRVSDPKKFRRDQALYLEVPVIGEIGKQVFSEGLAPVLTYAKANGIQHIVFYIDSEGGDLDEATEIYRLLRGSKDELKYHAIARKCQGSALAVGLWCAPFLLLPGGAVGGFTPAPTASEDEAEQVAIVRARMADKVVADTGRRGPAADVIKAMIDPTEELSAWRDKDGVLQTAPAPPADVPADHVIFTVGKGSVLSLSQEQLVKLGLPAFKGDAKDLGGLLKLPGWTLESDFGRKTMDRVAAEMEKKAKAQQSAYEAKVKKNTSRREETNKYIDESMKQAAQWDPTKGDYETYAAYWGWAWGSAYSTETTVWTRESQQKWRTRTDATMYYLKNAAKGLVAMKKLDAEAEKLDLEPTFPKGEIDAMLRDLQVKLVALEKHKDRTGT